MRIATADDHGVIHELRWLAAVNTGESWRQTIRRAARPMSSIPAISPGRAPHARALFPQSTREPWKPIRGRHVVESAPRASLL
jgi:hypothetical protein